MVFSDSSVVRRSESSVISRRAGPVAHPAMVSEPNKAVMVVMRVRTFFIVTYLHNVTRKSKNQFAAVGVALRQVLSGDGLFAL